jgi:hypothetical protein
MDVRQLLWGASPWWILVCVLAGLLYAGLLYSRTPTLWSRTTNGGLFALRFLLATLLCLLLLEPYLRQLTRHIEEPAFIVAIDNSLSVPEGGASPELLQQTISRLQEQLGNKGRVELRTLGGSIPSSDSLQFTAQTTDLSQLLSGVRSDFENRNLAGIILLSDGIYNQGISPSYVPYPFPVYTLGLGDTLPKTDVNLKNLYYNKVAYQGNQFRIRAEITQNGYDEQPLTLTVRRGGRVLQQQQIRFPRGSSLLEEEVVLNADEAGLQHYVFEVSGAQNEYTNKNNVRHAYIEVIEGREKILIVAHSPHPDITALRRAIERNQNYQTFLYLPGITDYKQETYDLVILHGLPSGRAIPRMDEILKNSRARWYILSLQTNLNLLNQQQELVQIQSMQREFDQAFPLLNGNFDLFTYPGDNRRIIDRYPPIQVPFGRIQVSGWGRVLLQQRIGRVETDRPLMVVGLQEDQKVAVTLGEGLWQWRVQEYAATEDFKAFDELVQKTVQLLAARDDRRLFRVYPLQEEVLDTEGLTLETEVYNKIFERIWGQTVNLVITDEGGRQYRFTYQNTRNSPRYTVQNLPEGVYRYRATTELNGETLTANGRFSVQNLQLESLELTANHNLLRNISGRTGGEYYHFTQQDQLLQELNELEARNVISADEAYEPVLSLEWLLALLLLLVSVEWFVRKFNGSY